MKKAKILLTAICMLTIVGGTLAFKANRGAVIFCSALPAAPGFCPQLDDYTITNVPNNYPKKYCTRNGQAACTILTNITVLI